MSPGVAAPLRDAFTTLTALAHEPGNASRLVFDRTLPAREARFAEPARPLHPVVETRLGARGIERLWAHQAAAVDRLREGAHVAIATGTASGKSLCYQVPIAEIGRASCRERV